MKTRWRFVGRHTPLDSPEHYLWRREPDGWFYLRPVNEFWPDGPVPKQGQS